MKKLMLVGASVVGLSVGAAQARTCAAAVTRPQVKIVGEIGAKFETCLRGNVLKLDLEKDFFKPFVERTRKGGFIGLGKHADAAVHFAANTRDPVAIAHKEKVIQFINVQRDV